MTNKSFKNIISSGDICVFISNTKRHVCVMTTGAQLVSVDTGWFLCEDVMDELDEFGRHHESATTYVESIYDSLYDFQHGSKPVWEAPRVIELKIGMKVKLRKGLTQGITYGKMKCSPVAEFFSGEMVEIVSISPAAGTVEVKFKGSKSFLVSPIMLDANTTMEVNPFMTQNSDFNF